MRRTAILLTIVLAWGTAAAGASAATVRSAAASVTVDPSTGLSAEQSVHVTATGFTPDAQMGAAECVAGAVAISRCDAVSIAFGSSDGSGDATFTVPVRAEIVLGSGPVDCTVAGACVVAAAEISNLIPVSAPISFANLPKPRAGSIETPTAPVAENESTTIAADHFAPHVLVALSTCAHGATSADDCGHQVFDYTDDGGHSADIVLTDARLDTANGAVDCTGVGACDFAAWDVRAFTATVATAPMRFAPHLAGSLTVTPSTGLHDGDTVTVSGSGWPAEAYLEIDECSGAQTDNCAVSSSTQTDDDGTFSLPFDVLRHSGPHTQYFDCEVEPCAISANWFAGAGIVTATQPIDFAFTPVPVASHYTADELAAAAHASKTLAISAARLQRDGSWALAWVLGLTGTEHITPAADAGPKSIRTAWGTDDYAAMAPIARSEGATVGEFQKTGALFLAFVLALQP